MTKKYALILGASGGIGTNIATKLAESGWSLYLHFNTGGSVVTSMIEQLVTKYPVQEFIPIEADLINDDVTKITDNIFSLNAIVLAQGITEYGLFDQLSKQRMTELIMVNYEQPLLLIKSLQAKLVQAEFGRIVFISSIYGKTGSAMEVMYSSLKGALDSFVNAYAKEVAGLGITVNSVAPGAVKTPMTESFSAEELQSVTDEIPLGRMSKPDDVSFWVDTLLKPAAEYMTGETLYVDGGWLV